MKTTREILIAAKAAARNAASLTESVKNAALMKMADALEQNADEILQANAVDIQTATGVHKVAPTALLRHPTDLAFQFFRFQAVIP